MKDRVSLLIEILIDKNARIDERDDAAIYLGDYDEDRALDALTQVATDPSEEQSIMASVGESIGKIWIKRNKFDHKEFNNLNDVAKFECYTEIVKEKPEWIKLFNLEV